MSGPMDLELRPNRPRPSRLLATALTLLALLASAAPQAAASGAVLVVPPRTDAELAPIAAGHALWLENRLLDAGVGAVRRSGIPTEISEILTLAAGADFDWVVVPELRVREGQVTVRLLLFAPASGDLAAAATAVAPLEALGDASEETAEKLLTQLGLPPEATAGGLAPQLDELAATSRALRYREAGELAPAWREVEGRLTPTAMRLREEIVTQAREPGGSPLQRARVLAYVGDEREAWRLIADRVEAESEKPSPDPEVLLAAAEIQRAGGALAGARERLEAILEAHPDHAGAQLDLARVLAAQNDLPGARAAFARAAELDPRSPKPYVLLADLERADPARQARALIEAGHRASRRLDVDRAERYFEKALRLDANVAGESWMGTAEIEQRLGRPIKALARYERARLAGVGDVSLFRNIGRAHQALGDTAKAEEAYRQALSKSADDTASLRGLGEVYLAAGRVEEALPLLTQAAEDSPLAGRSLARALHQTGRSEEAVKVLLKAGAAEDLREAATIQAAVGRPQEARASLTRAIELEPYEPELHGALAQLVASQGDPEEARRARELAAFLGGEQAEKQSQAAPSNLAVSLDGLILTFASQVVDAESKSVSFLGARFAPGWEGLALEWLHPRAIDRRAIERALETAVNLRFDLLPPPAIPKGTIIEEAIDALYDFDSDASLDAQSIVAVNRTFGSQGVFLARIRRNPTPDPASAEGSEAGACVGMERFELELRLLSGQEIEYSSILANTGCPAGGLQAFGTWNVRAVAIYSVLGLLLLFPLLRGWGTIAVSVSLPPRTKGFFSLHVSKNPDAVSAQKKQKERFKGLKRTLRYLSRYHRDMVGRETVFRWIPARPRSKYSVTLMGPLKDAKGEEIIGHFLEERRIRVVRGKVARIEFDLEPKECAVEVQVMRDGAPAKGTRVAVQGDRGSLRYAPEGAAFLYLGKGDYRILMGSDDRVGVTAVEVRSLENAIPLHFDLGDPSGLVFTDCPGAVDPYLQGDYATAATALAAAGQEQAAHLMRAELYQRTGDAQRAAAEFEAAGRLDEAAELASQAGTDLAHSADLFERAGDHARAAETYRAAGDLAAAGRAYESAYDFDNAIDCYREVGDRDKVLQLLEQTGAYLEAAQLARELGQNDRAMNDLHQIARNDSSWGDGRALLAELLAEGGEHEIAVETFEEALEAAGGEQASAALQERYAQLLEKCGDREKAVRAWTNVRKLDPSRDDVSTRLHTLRESLQRDALTMPVTATTGAQRDSRYELLEEIGRGGMGVVYKARDRRLGRLIALKRLPESLRNHPEAVKLFLREARAAASLNHRNIVTVHDAGEEDGSYYIAMELMEGLPLNHILSKRGVLSPRDVARLGIQTAAGLGYAHEQRVVHRDIKAGNLFFTRDKLVKIMDFGLAKTIEEVRKSSTRIGGTPYYMAPEQAAGDRVDHRTDLYALGVTLFQLLTGDLPFREGDLAFHHRHTAPPDPRELEAGIPEELARIVLDLMAKAPDDRPQSAQEVVTRLQQVLAALRSG